MGGLVARACLEEARLAPGNVDRLIMVSPPNHGTNLALFAVGTDLWEHWVNRARWFHHGNVFTTRSPMAWAKRLPNSAQESEFLMTLNARPRETLTSLTQFCWVTADSLVTRIVYGFVAGCRKRLVAYRAQGVQTLMPFWPILTKWLRDEEMGSWPFRAADSRTWPIPWCYHTDIFSSRPRRIQPPLAKWQNLCFRD